jgi:hypothetical protein
MIFRINVEMENDAFRDAAGTELGRILRGMAELVEDGQIGYDAFPVHDSNGNTVGRASIR